MCALSGVCLYGSAATVGVCHSGYKENCQRVHISRWVVRDAGSNRRRPNAPPPNRGKPTMEIYRPPNVRTDVLQNGMLVPNPRLNVHAKEFTMKPGDLSTSRSSMNLPAALGSHAQRPHALQSSKSSGNVLHQLHHSKSSGSMLHQLHQLHPGAPQGHRVHFQLEPQAGPTELPPAQHIPPSGDFPAGKSPLKSYSASEMKTVPGNANGNKLVPDALESRLMRISPALQTGLKRSKSLGAADMGRQAAAGYRVAKEAPDLGEFPAEIQAAIRQAVDDPNRLSARMLMELVKHIMGRVTDSVTYALPAAKLCITIIEKEQEETFLESLLNTCRQWCQERDRILKSGPSTTRFCAFMQFLNEMYCELKRRQLQLKTQYDGVPPRLVLLSLLHECCQECLKPPSTQGETDSLFFVLTSVGRDLEQELPGKLTHLIASARDAFLLTPGLPPVKKTLLQLIELRAAKWQLSASAVMYYTTQH
ncbi:CBP80/20-dependent translation initiation factor isoform X2 [Bacillus rossius redtenbacheri]|uniref:CBP80/20-dependent translation initiation factor isoform X2 n=1 Tax=Bacillus rossius redtenbacheri TaxID=93214 RepID=UPI002FDDA00F